MNTSLFNTFLIVVAFLFGLYEIGYGFYAWRLNGFKFYITAGFLIGAPFIAVGLITLLAPDLGFQPWEILVALLWLFGVIWKAWRKRIAKTEHPQEWAKWEQILNRKR